MWVNLSPYETERVVPKELGITDMGQELLGQDYLLKRLAASLTYPETELGNKYWQAMNSSLRGAQAAKQSQPEIATHTARNDNAQLFNKVWIIPDKAVVYDAGDRAFVKQAHLKVMCEEDYLAMQQNYRLQITNYKLPNGNVGGDNYSPADKDATNLFKQYILPSIEKEINEGKNFVPLRQIYHAVILASWFKNKLKTTIMAQSYANKKKIAGIEADDQTLNQKIYDKYVEAFKQGAYEVIQKSKVKSYNFQKIVTRRYFSGGASMAPIDGIVVTQAEPGTPEGYRKLANGRSSVKARLLRAAAKTVTGLALIGAVGAKSKDATAQTPNRQIDTVVSAQENKQVNPFLGVSQSVYSDGQPVVGTIETVLAGGQKVSVIIRGHSHFDASIATDKANNGLFDKEELSGVNEFERKSAYCTLVDKLESMGASKAVKRYRQDIEAIKHAIRDNGLKAIVVESSQVDWEDTQKNAASIKKKLEANAAWAGLPGAEQRVDDLLLAILGPVEYLWFKNDSDIEGIKVMPLDDKNFLDETVDLSNKVIRFLHKLEAMGQDGKYSKELRALSSLMSDDSALAALSSQRIKQIAGDYPVAGDMRIVVEEALTAMHDVLVIMNKRNAIISSRLIDEGSKFLQIGDKVMVLIGYKHAVGLADNFIKAASTAKSKDPIAQSTLQMRVESSEFVQMSFEARYRHEAANMNKVQRRGHLIELARDVGIDVIEVSSKESKSAAVVVVKVQKPYPDEALLAIVKPAAEKVKKMLAEHEEAIRLVVSTDTPEDVNAKVTAFSQEENEFLKNTGGLIGAWLENNRDNYEKAKAQSYIIRLLQQWDSCDGIYLKYQMSTSGVRFSSDGNGGMNDVVILDVNNSISTLAFDKDIASLLDAVERYLPYTGGWSALSLGGWLNAAANGSLIGGFSRTMVLDQKEAEKLEMERQARINKEINVIKQQYPKPEYDKPNTVEMFGQFGRYRTPKQMVESLEYRITHPEEDYLRYGRLYPLKLRENIQRLYPKSGLDDKGRERFIRYRVDALKKKALKDGNGVIIMVPDFNHQPMTPTPVPLGGAVLLGMAGLGFGSKKGKVRENVDRPTSTGGVNFSENVLTVEEERGSKQTELKGLDGIDFSNFVGFTPVIVSFRRSMRNPK